MSTSDPHKGTERGAEKAPVDHLVLDGERLPCRVKVAVYQGGLAAGLGIAAADPARMANLLSDGAKAGLIREALRKQVGEELARQGVTSGVQEEAILAAVEEFVGRVATGSGAMATRKVAEGQPPEPGEDGWLEYPMNPGGHPLHTLGRADQVSASGKVHQVKEGEILVVRHPPRAGQDGCDVRGERVAPGRPPREVSLEGVAGMNTTVAGEKLVAAIEGAYREDSRGRVRVVQEVETEEVNAATGDLPRSGVAATHFWVRRGVRSGFRVFTTEDVFVGSVQEAGALDRDTRVRARNLFVRGQVAGGPLPAEYLDGEMEGLEEAERRRIAHHIERSQIEVEEVFGAREVLGRNASAGTILIQTHSIMAALDAAEDVLVDGNLAGGVVSFGRRLQVVGNLGDAEGSVTRIRVGEEDRAGQKQGRLKADLQGRKAALETLVGRLEAHQEGMERQAKKGAYWAALLKGEKRPPRGPVESRILVQFFQAAKQKARLEQEVADGKREVADLGQMLQGDTGEGGEEGAALEACVGGTVYPGVLVELVRPLETADLEEKVLRKAGGGRVCSLQEIKKELSKEVSDYVTPRQERLEERRQALDQMFKGREQRPHAPELPNKRFQAEVLFAASDEEGAGKDGGVEAPGLHREGVLYVYAREPQKVYFKRVWRVEDPLKDATITVEKGDHGHTVRCVPSRTPPTPWQQDPEVLRRLEAIQILGQSARALLSG